MGFLLYESFVHPYFTSYLKNIMNTKTILAAVSILAVMAAVAQAQMTISVGAETMALSLPQLIIRLLFIRLFLMGRICRMHGHLVL